MCRQNLHTLFQMLPSAPTLPGLHSGSVRARPTDLRPLYGMGPKGTYGDYWRGMEDSVGNALPELGGIDLDAIIEATNGRGKSAPAVQCINALTLATSNMAASCAFYESLGLTLTYGGPDSSFSTYSADTHLNYAHVNLYTSDDFTPAPPGKPQPWGRCVFYTDNVDSFYEQTVARGLKPEFAPQDAVWGERYFHILDPQGHELSFAMPIAGHSRWKDARRLQADAKPGLVQRQMSTRRCLLAGAAGALLLSSRPAAVGESQEAGYSSPPAFRSGGTKPNIEWLR